MLARAPTQFAGAPRRGPPQIHTVPFLKEIISMSSTAVLDLSALSGAVSGRVVLPADDDYDVVQLNVPPALSGRRYYDKKRRSE